MDHTYINAAASRGGCSHQCLGLKLAPLTVGHLFLLLEINSPFVTGKRETFEDFLLAVFACSCRHDKSKANLRKWWAPLFFRMWGYLNRRRNFAEELLSFHDYLTEQMAVPTYKKREGASASSAPIPYQLLAALMTEFGMSESEAMDMEVKHVHCLCAANAEMRGHVDTQSEDFKELWAYAEEQDRMMMERSKN